jgi:chromosome partitioning protein
VVLIPCRPSALDLEQVDIVCELAQTHDKPMAYVLNHADPRWKLTRTAGAYLSRDDRVVLDPPISFRQAHMAAPTIGKSAAELDPNGPAAREIDELWESVKKFIAVGKKGRTR